MKYFPLIIGLTIGLCSCSEDHPVDPRPVIESSPHFPTDLGQILDYKVYSVTYSNGGSNIDTSQFFIREEITELIERTDGSMFYSIRRSTGQTADGPWQYEATWSTVISDNEAIRTEGNQSHVKLIFPAHEGEEWDAQKYFDAGQQIAVGPETMDFYKEWRSKYEEVNTSITLDGTVYNQTHLVNLANHENRLELRFAREYYARGIGLIYREVRVLDTQCFSGCEQISWEEKAERGIIWIQKLIGHQ